MMKSMARGTSTLRTILGNAGWLVLAEVTGRLLTFLAIAHLSRRLGPGPMGMVELGLGIFGFLALVALGGVEVLATRRTARTRVHTHNSTTLCGREKEVGRRTQVWDWRSGCGVRDAV